MTEMPALSLWQPWASLLVTRQPATAADLLHPDCTYMAAEYPGHHLFCNKCGWAKSLPPVKRFETRSWPCPEKWWGQRMAFHAAARRVTPGDVGHYHVEQLRHDAVMYEIGAGDDIDLPLGAIVGSGVVAACYPIVGSPLFGVEHILRRRDRLYLERYPTGPEGGKSTKPISGQLPYGDFTPGRFAWLIEDAAPTTERCPWCWIEGCHTPGVGRRGRSGLGCICSVCRGTGRCDPIPARGRQRIWHWTPEVAA